MKNSALILAGGVGLRMRTAVPKQFLPLGGIPVVSYSIMAFESLEDIEDVVVVCHKDHMSLMEKIVSEMKPKKLKALVTGGETRQKSSHIGLKSCSPDTDYVLIHDAARPFISKTMVSDLLLAAKKTGSAGPAVDLSDTVVEIKGGCISNIPKRDGIKRIQTPQAFKYDVIMNAHEKALEKGITAASDDCGLVLASGGKVSVVPGSEENLKITSALDMALAEVILSGRACYFQG